MADALLIVCVVMLAGIAALLLLLWRKKTSFDVTPLTSAVEKSHERMERSVREEIARNREETAAGARQNREEIASSLKSVGDTLTKSVAGLGTQQKDQLELFAKRLDALTGAMELKLGEMRTTVETRLASTSRELAEQLGRLTETTDKKLEAIRGSVDDKLKGIREENTRQLEQMRATVDEKLQGTLEKRLGESFKIVSERLEAVSRGLGEMQALATGVGDLKKVLSNVKTRGTWGEVQLGAMLEQVLNPDQYAANVATRPGAGERVEFAIKLPGRGDDARDMVWLPIDAKFPVEDYQRLVDAQEAADAEAAEIAGKQLENRIKSCAADICQKYISPPHTTDFGILFLPTEGLFAEVIRRTGLVEYVQRECRVVIAGPTTLWSILNSLQMGFRTLAVQKRSGEVWKLLGAIKTEWAKYGAVLDKVKTKLQQATNEMDHVSVRTRAIDRALQKVQQLPAAEVKSLLPIDGSMEIPIIEHESAVSANENGPRG